MINKNRELENRFLVLEANAGSGKTFNLVSRYLGLLFLDVSPEKIFALTFTKKATKEMYNRVIHSLKNPKTSGEVLEISKGLGLSENEIELKSKESLEKLLNSDIKILTIDSLGQSILKKFSHYLDIIPNFKTVERIDEKKFKTIFLEKVQNNNQYRKNILNIENIDKKTNIDTIFLELKQFYLKEVELHKMQEKFKNLTVFNNLKVLEADILKIAYLIAEWLLDDNHKLSGKGQNALNFSNIEELLDVGKTWLTKDSLDQFSFFKKAFKSSSSEIVDKAFEDLKILLEIYFERKRELIFKNMFQLFELYIQERENFIKREAKFSFDDINHFLVKLILDKKVDSQFIYFRLDSTIEHLLIDEFQDTSLLQYRVLQPIIEDILSGGSSLNKSFFYVGDKMQSLYRFRGGFNALFDHIQDDNLNITKKTLPKNYRSKENIVNFINSLFGTKQIIGKDRQLGGSVFMQNVENPIENVVLEVENLIKIGAELNSIAVICSTNREIDQLTELLKNKNIDVQAQTNRSLIEHPPVKAVTQYILYLYHIRDSESKFYLKNFQAIIGKNPKEKCENSLNIKLNNFSLYQIGIKIIEHFQLFDGDYNTLQFLESLQKTYLDIDDFIYNYHLEVGKVVKTNKNGINLTTIHKSKGLEFENVIFVDYSLKDRGYSKNPKTLILYKGIDTQDIAWSIGLDNKIYSRYLNIAESEKELKNGDNINRLYVALTRAKNSLTILKKDKHSSLNLVQIDKVDTSEFNNKLEIKQIENNILEIDDSEIEFEFENKFYGYQNEDSIKDSDEVEQVKEFDLESELNNLKKKVFGIALHSTIEMMNNFTLENLKISIENTKNRFSHSLSDSDFQDIYNRVSFMISDLKFKTLIHGGKITKESGYIFEGKSFYIDMLIEKNDEIIICDFKSSENYEFYEKYQIQIRNYIDIIRDIEDESKKVTGYLIYIYKNKTKIQEVI